MTKNARDKVQGALDRLALALADRGHTWTPEERHSYELATRLLS